MSAYQYNIGTYESFKETVSLLPFSNLKTIKSVLIDVFWDPTCSKSADSRQLSSSPSNRYTFQIQTAEVLLDTRKYV